MSEIGFIGINIKRQGLYYVVKSDMFEQYTKQIRIGPFTRVFHWFTFRLMVTFMKRWALWRESGPRIQDNSFFQSYTIGFSMHGVKPG